MTDSSNAFKNKLIILLAVVAGIVLFIFVGWPLLKLLFGLLFIVSGFIAGIFKYILFVLLSIAAVLGLLLLISWIIQEFTN